MTFLWIAALVTAVLVWFRLALVVSFGFFRKNRVRGRLETRELLPYSMFAKYRILGALGAVSRAMRIKSAMHVPLEIIDAHRSIKLDDMKELRDIMVDMDALPTVQKGLAAVGVPSNVRPLERQVHKIASPYTHPMPHPPYLIPGVPAKPFYDPKEFEWARVLGRSSTPRIRPPRGRTTSKLAV